MYVTKKAGRKGYRFFTDDMQKESRQRARMEQSLRNDVKSGNFEINYQPMVNLISGDVSGYEALLRWRHEDRVHLPDEFLPIVEELHLMGPLGQWSLDSACRELSRWRGDNARREEITLAVNLSLSQFRDNDIQLQIERLLEKHAMTPDLLELEISERILNEVPDKAVRQLISLRDQGVHIALDNFGSGYSALSYLRRLPVDIVKIDQCFIRDIGRDKSTESIIRAMTSLAHDMGIRVVAEGIESEEQLSFVTDLEYDRAQGFFLGRPEVITRLEDNEISATPRTQHPHSGQFDSPAPSS